MPKYKVKEKSLIGNEIHEAGAIVEYDGLPAENLEPQCAEGEAKYQEYLAVNAERVRVMKEQHTESAVGDQVAFAKTIAKAVADALASNAAAEKVGQTTAMKVVTTAPAKNGRAESLT